MNDELSNQVDSLRRQNFVLLLALIVIAGTMAVYLRYQSVVMGKTVDGIKPQATMTIQTYSKVTQSLNLTNLQNFVTQISAYAATHPEFRPVLEKYGWKPSVAPAAPAKK